MPVRVRAVLICVCALAVFSTACAATPTPPAPSQPTTAIISLELTRAASSTERSPAMTTSPRSTAAPTQPPSTERSPQRSPAAPTQPLPSPTNPVPSAPTNYFGVNTNGEILYNDQVRALATVGGVQMVRLSIYWRTIEKTPGAYTWGSSDGLVKTLTENNFAPLVLIEKNPEWAANTPCGPVSDLLALERFIRALVARYPQVKHWALYNEPDNSAYPRITPAGCFGGDDINGNGKRDVEDYAEMLRVARRALHQANPDALLLIGALAYDNFDPASVPPGYPGGGNGGSFDYTFAPRLFQYMQAHPLANGEKYADVFTFNFFQIYGPYWQRQAGGVGISAKANMLNTLMRDNGVSFPLLVSETGEDTTRVGNAGQSDYVTKTYVRGLASELLAVVWWTYQDFPDSAAPPTNTWKYGLIDQATNVKPAYAAFQTASRELTGAQFSQVLPIQGGEAYLFNKDGGGKAVAWSKSDAPITISFAATQLQVMDLYGAKKLIADGAPEDTDSEVGRIGVSVGPSPFYIQAVGP